MWKPFSDRKSIVLRLPERLPACPDSWSRFPVVRGYEIHMGETVYTETAQPFAVLTDGRKDGCVCADGTVCGTYLHGIFDTPELTQKLVQLLLEKKGISGTTVPAVDFAAKKEQEYDKLADLLREHLDMPKIYDILNSWGKTP